MEEIVNRIRVKDEIRDNEVCNELMLHAHFSFFLVIINMLPNFKLK